VLHAIMGSSRRGRLHPAELDGSCSDRGRATRSIFDQYDPADEYRPLIRDGLGLIVRIQRIVTMEVHVRATWPAT
jgi:hypothetical protein